MSSDRYLSPIVLQLLGAALLIAAAVFWGVTGRESVLLMSSAMSLIGIGAYRGTQQSLRKAPQDADAPPPIAPAPDEDAR